MNAENQVTNITEEPEQTFKDEVMKVIDDRIRPALMMDGGDMAVHGFNKLENGKYELLVQLVGACGSCPSSSMTMKMGVERMLVDTFEQIEMVTAI